MPGYGFSSHTSERGLDVLSIGDLWAKLMSENLGYKKFGAQGGDWGASVTAQLGFAHKDKVTGIHSTSVTRPTPYMGPGSAWIVEKYRTWSDCGGDVEKRFTKDELLTTITIYWVTQSIGSSTKLYYETLRKPWDLKEGEKIEVPCGIAVFPAEISVPPREWAERSYNVQQWTIMPAGGHFAALEEPNRLVEDIRNFFRPLR